MTEIDIGEWPFELCAVSHGGLGRSAASWSHLARGVASAAFADNSDMFFGITFNKYCIQNVPNLKFSDPFINNQACCMWGRAAMQFAEVYAPAASCVWGTDGAITTDFRRFLPSPETVLGPCMTAIRPSAVEQLAGQLGS